jgi:hypothetical protein
MYGAEAFYASKEVQSGVDGFLEKMPNSHVSAIAMGVISGLFDISVLHSVPDFDFVVVWL